MTIMDRLARKGIVERRKDRPRLCVSRQFELPKRLARKPWDMS
jgi:predicted transcriptional regulator